ncbi:MAG: polyprenyl synthetase family protein [Anaerolineae bacterium]
MPTDLSPYLDAIEQELQDLVRTDEQAVAPLYAMMQYHMGWVNQRFEPEHADRGKRLRPLLCLLTCEAVGGDWRRSLPAAAALELVHNFSLIHDDIEDDSAERRHRTTVWTLWGLAQGVNTGDAMWALARTAPSRLRARGFDADTCLRVCEILDETCLELCSGQFLDISFEDMTAVSPGAYQRMVAGKTAALLSACSAIGAILGGAGAPLVEALRAFGFELGLSFQMVDDILGIWGDAAVTGKPAASDLLTKKKSLPVLYAQAWEWERDLHDLERLYARPVLTVDDVPAVLALLDRAGALAYTQERVRDHYAKALEHLSTVAPTLASASALDPLRSLAASLVDRSR